MKVPPATPAGLLLAAALAASAQQGPPIDRKAPAARRDELAGPGERANYGLGLWMGRLFREQAVEVDPDALLRGLRDGTGGAEGLLSEAELAEVMLKFQQDLARRQRDRVEELDRRRRAQDAEFLEANRAREGVQTLPSGLQYRVLDEGRGPRPGRDDTVQVRYRGRLVPGLTIDATDPDGPPVRLPIRLALPGLAEALPRMKVGATWELVLPPNLGHGDRPRPGSLVPRQAVLIYEVTLLGIEPRPSKPARP